jgi:hypothetical protein
MTMDYQTWLTHVFDHQPDAVNKWFYALDDSDWWNPFTHPRETVTYVTRLFADPLDALAPYSDAQIGEGLWYIVSAGNSDMMFALFGSTSPPHLPPAPWPKLEACLDAMVHFFEVVMAPRCGSRLGQQEALDTYPPALNTTCYMWWDIMPITVREDDPDRFHDLLTGTMARILSIDSLPCQESALHGLGHWHTYAPARVEAAIAAYHTEHPVLRTYAANAARGLVL